MENLIESKSIFDSIRHIDENGNEYWKARELQQVLDYTEWRKFIPVINKAIKSCEHSDNSVFDHFARVGGMVAIGSKTKRKVEDYKLSRYACYLIAQNSDPRKEVVALAQTYFAIQTRKQELLEKKYNELTEDEKRLYRREQTKKFNKSLYEVATKKGVKNYDKFTNAGYKGLYNGETADDIAKRKKLRYREDILDHMGSVELGANIFRITQTESLLNHQENENEKQAVNTHYRVGKAVRDTIKKIGGTMPEELKTPSRSLKEIEKSNKKNIL